MPGKGWRCGFLLLALECAVYAIAYGWLAEKCASVPAFAVREKTVLGNFSYAKLPMVRDLQASIDALTEHDLVAALAGDPWSPPNLQSLLPGG